MTVGRGQTWGTAAEAPSDAEVVASDAAVAAAIGGRPVVVRGGDLHRTVGEPSGSPTLALPIDALAVIVAGVSYVGVAHAVIRRPGWLGWWRGPVLAVMNAQYHGRFDVAPRAHPNDGQLDVVELAVATGLGQRRQMRERLPSGTHVPHPGLRTRRITHERLEFGETLAVYVDGILVGRAESVDVEVQPDAGFIYA